MGRLLTRFFQRYAKWACQRPLLPLIFIVLVIGLSLLSVRHLRLDASFEALLPEDTPSVMARNEARQRVGSSDSYLIAIQSPDPEANFRFAKAVAAEIDGWEESEWVMHSIDLEVFREKALLFMSLEDLRELADLVELRVLRGQCEFRGNCNEMDLRTDAERAQDSDRLEALAKRYRGQHAETAGDRSELAKRHPGLSDALMNQDGTVATVVASLEGSSSNIEFSRRMLSRGEALIEQLDPHSFHPEMIAKVQGAYQSSNEYETVLSDATTASLISLGLVVVVVMLFLRRVSAVILVATALLVGIVWTMGFTGISYPTLNTVTAVIFGILLGMGIDYSIHYCVATRAERVEGVSLAEAMHRAGESCIPAMLTSALTTAAALLTLSAAHNRGFREFGVIGAVGVILCLLAALLVIPPLWGVLEKLRRESKPLPIPSDQWMARRGVLIALLIALAFSAAFGWRAPSLSFEYDLSNLRAPRDESDRIAHGSANRLGGSTSPAALLGDNEEELRRAHRLLTKRRDEGDERIRSVITIETFIPPDQEEKLEEVERLRSLLRPRTLRRVAKQYRPELDRLAEMARVEEPLRVEALPLWARQAITERDGSIGRFGLLHMRIPGGDARVARDFQEDYGSIDVGETRPIRVASSRFVVADVVFTMQRDGRLMVILSAIAVILLLLIDLRSFVGAFACSLVLFFGILWGLGAAELLGWKLGVFNMLVIPVALGLGIDGTIHLYHRYQRDREAFLKSPLGATGLAVLASTVTTLAGFAGLLFVQHRGLATIGQLSVLTVGCTLVAVLGVLPGILLAVGRRKKVR